MSKNILYVLIAALTFQSASAYFDSSLFGEKNRIEDAISWDSLKAVEYQFKCLEKEGVVFTPEMLEACCQFSLERIAQFEACKAEFTDPYKLAGTSDQTAMIAAASAITGALGYGFYSLFKAGLHASYEELNSISEKLRTVGFALCGVGLLTAIMLKTVQEDLNNPLRIQNRLDEQAKIYEFLQQKLFNANCVCQAA